MRPAKISKELADAAYDDFKRKAVDEAKKRAVSQRVDYDTFKNMVLTAHLKPLRAPGGQGQDRPLPCWSFGADGAPSKRQEEGPQTQLAPLGSSVIPTTSGDFYREWRRNLTVDHKYSYLKLCGPDTLRAVFSVEVNAEVLREMLAVLEACWLGHGGAAEGEEGGAGAAMREAAFVVQLLQALSAAGRFSLTVKLLGSSSKPVLERLFASLLSAAAAIVTPEPDEAAPAEAGDAPTGPLQQQAQTFGMCSVKEVAELRKTYGLKD